MKDTSFIATVRYNVHNSTVTHHSPHSSSEGKSKSRSSISSMALTISAAPETRSSSAWLSGLSNTSRRKSRPLFLYSATMRGEHAQQAGNCSAKRVSVSKLAT